MNRRGFLAALASTALPARGGSALDMSRVSAITDEIAHSQTESIEFAHKYGMRWLSLREVPGASGAKRGSYYSLSAPELRQAGGEFKQAGIGIAFLDTPFLKFGLPGTEPLRRKPEDPAAKEKRLAREKTQFAARFDDLRQGILASQAFGCPRLRIFTFSRVADPESIYPRIAETISELAAMAQKEGVKLLIENEASQNCGTSAETAKLITLLPANVGINWDSLNGVGLGEKPFPDGYNTLPKDRVWNVHVKGKSLLDYPEHLDWTPILRALEHDNFQGWLELETHIFGEQQVASSHASMREIVRLLGAKPSNL